MVAPHAQRYFRLSAKVACDARHLPEAVEAAVRAALRAAFGYAARPLAEPASAAAVIATMQGVAGVHDVDLDALAIYSDQDPVAQATLAAVLPARPARLGAAGDPAPVELAELLTLFEDGVALTMERADA